MNTTVREDSIIEGLRRLAPLASMWRAQTGDVSRANRRLERSHRKTVKYETKSEKRRSPKQQRNAQTLIPRQKRSKSLPVD